MNNIYILLGANLGNPIEQLHRAKERIGQDIGPIIKQSSLYETEAWGVSDQPIFYNQVLMVQSTLPPFEVLDKCLKIENDLGRVRKEKWGARIIDIDILYIDNKIIQHDRLVIPHPLLHMRQFALIPLCEIAAGFLHPLLKKSNKDLLTSCEDTSFVKKNKH